MIVRDESGLIGQHDPNVPSYLDFGDSCNRCGIMSLSGSEQDRSVMSQFVLADGSLVRHPAQAPWNDPAKTSRDALVTATAGMSPELALKVQNRYKLFINKDILMPDVRNHLRLCAGLPGTLTGYLFLNISIVYAAKVQPEHELNQLMSMCIVAGPKYVKMLCKMHPDWKANITEYWAGYPFRDQAEIGQAFIAKIEQELAK